MGGCGCLALAGGMCSDAGSSLSGFAVNALTTTCIETTSPSAHLQSEREQQQHQRAAAGERRSVREESGREEERERAARASERAAAVAAAGAASLLSLARAGRAVLCSAGSSSSSSSSQAAAAQRSPFNILLSSRNRPCQMIFSWPTAGGSEPAGDNIRRVRAGTAEQRIRFDGKHSERTLLRRPFQNRALLDARDAVARVDVEHDRLRKVHAE